MDEALPYSLRAPKAGGARGQLASLISQDEPGGPRSLGLAVGTAQPAEEVVARLTAVGVRERDEFRGAKELAGHEELVAVHELADVLERDAEGARHRRQVREESSGGVVEKELMEAAEVSGERDHRLDLEHEAHKGGGNAVLGGEGEADALGAVELLNAGVRQR